MAERLGTALQKLLQRFDSASDLYSQALNDVDSTKLSAFLFFGKVQFAQRLHNTNYTDGCHAETKLPFG